MHVLNADNTGPRIKCPECGKAVFWNPSYPFRPFCSERCKLIDLGGWASEAHVIAGEPAYLDNLEEFPGAEGAESD